MTVRLFRARPTALLLLGAILVLPMAAAPVGRAHSPEGAVAAVREAALAGDLDRFEALIDREALAASLERQMAERLRLAASDGRQTPLGPLGLSLAEGFIPKLVDASLEPLTLSAAILAGPQTEWSAIPPLAALGLAGEAPHDLRIVPVSAERFRVERADDGHDGAALIFERHDGRWILVDADLGGGA